MTQANHQLTQPVKRDRPITVVDDRMRKMIAGAVAEIDPAQIAILRKLTPADRVYQALSMIAFAENTSAYRLRKQQPGLSEAEALVAARRRSLDFRARVEEQWRNNR
jgi:hypothetical protein